jgi:predicted nuclease of predicted toxin-antitoxin system
MKFVIDNAVSPTIAKILKAHGYDSVHVRDYGIQDAIDEVVFDRAAAEERVLVYRPDEFEDRIRLGDPFVKAILREGRVLYG